MPVALDKQKLFARDRRKANEAEIKLVARFTGGKSVHLGVYLVTADGKLLAPSTPLYSSADKLMSLMKQAVAKFGPIKARPLPARAVNPDRGVGYRADGTARLALTARYTAKSMSAGQPVFDSIVFTRAHWAGLAPPAEAKGKYRVPEATARQFARAVSASSDLSFLIRPRDLKSITLTGEALPDRAGLKRVWLEGKMAGNRPHANEPTKPHHGSMSVEGLLTLDGKGLPVELLLVGEGEYQQPWMRRPSPTRAVVEWRAEAKKPATP